MNGSVRALGSNRNVQGLVLGLGILALTWELATWIVAGQDRLLLMTGVAIALAAVTTYILNDWRSGFYIFIVWVMFEDLARKYLGNNMLIFFGKDFLVAVIYLACLIARRRRQFEGFPAAVLAPLEPFLLVVVSSGVQFRVNVDFLWHPGPEALCLLPPAHVRVLRAGSLPGGSQIGF